MFKLLSWGCEMNFWMWTGPISEWLILSYAMQQIACLFGIVILQMSLSKAISSAFTPCSELQGRLIVFLCSAADREWGFVCVFLFLSPAK